MPNQLNHSELKDPQMKYRWEAVREPRGKSTKSFSRISIAITVAAATF
jgi:hypothetical protein